jgi:hypothetical protein
LRRYIDQAREEFYLDGPNDIDFIYLNDLLHTREALLYADRVRWESGFEWQKAGGPWGIQVNGLQHGLETVRALAAVLAFTPEALNIIDETWDSLELSDDTHWQEVAALNRQTLERFDELGWLSDADASTLARVLEWPMPLYPLEVGRKQIKLDELRAVRAGWRPN